jgi:hypothetical protein
LARLTAREDFITSCRRESFKSHKMLFNQWTCLISFIFPHDYSQMAISWRWRHCHSSKQWEMLTQWHSVTPQETSFFYNILLELQVLRCLNCTASSFYLTHIIGHLLSSLLYYAGLGWLTEPPKPDLVPRSCCMSVGMMSVVSGNANIAKFHIHQTCYTCRFAHCGFACLLKNYRGLC